MNRLLLILILTFSFQSWSKANDIRDFEIEGMSVGDSLLDFITISKIKTLRKSYYPNSKKFIMVDGSFDRMLKNYDAFYVTYQDNKKFIIHEIKGLIYFNETNECINQRDKIVSSIRVSFKENIMPSPDLTFPRPSKSPKLGFGQMGLLKECQRER